MADSVWQAVYGRQRMAGKNTAGMYAFEPVQINTCITSFVNLDHSVCMNAPGEIIANRHGVICIRHLTLFCCDRLRQGSVTAAAEYRVVCTGH